MMKKDKELRVASNPDCCLWRVDAWDLPYDTTLYVDSGCEVLYFLNGTLSAVCNSGQHCINRKSERKQQNKIDLIAANTDKIFDVLCGVGGIPYRDYQDETNTETSVGVSAGCKIRIRDAVKLYLTLGQDNIKPKDINELMRGKLAAIMREELAKKLQSNTYLSLTSQQNEISSVIDERFNKALEAIGLIVVSGTFFLGSFVFPEEYISARKAYSDKQNSRRELENDMRIKNRAQRNEMENLKILADAIKGNVTEEKKCPRCGMKITGSEQFCPKCGKKI